MSLLASVATVYVVYLLGLRLRGRATGAAAAGLVAVAPLASLTARYGTVDPTQSLFICLALYWSVLLFARRDAKTALWAGVCAGLAASAKYNGAVVLVAPLLAAVLAPVKAETGETPVVPTGKGKKPVAQSTGETPVLPAHAGETPVLPKAGVIAARWGACLAGALVAFVVTSPYTFLAWNEARAGLGFELQHMGQGEQLAVRADPSGLLFHLKHLLAPGLGLPLLLALVGVGWVVARRRREWYPLLGFALVWLVMIALAKVRYPRYELPLIAPLVLLAGAPLAELGKGKRLYQAALVLSGLLALFWCGQIALGLSSPRPQDLGLSYLLAQSTPEQAVGLVEAPWFADPPVDYCNGGTALGSVPLWRPYARTVRPVVVTGVRSVVSGGAPVPFFVTTDFGLGARVFGGDPEATAFALSLASQYRAAPQGGVPLTLVPWPLGPDWRYPWPRLEIWQFKQ